MGPGVFLPRCRSGWWVMEALPEGLRTALSQRVHQRYVNGDESAAGWQGFFGEDEGRELNDDDGGGEGGLVAVTGMEAYGEVFLIDHLWCTTHYHAREQLLEMPVIRDNMKYLLGIDDDDGSELADDDNDEEAHDCDDQGGDGGGVAVADGDALLAHLGVTANEAALMEEVTLDGLRGFSTQQPSSSLLSVLPSLFPRCRALGLQEVGLGPESGHDVAAALLDLPMLKAVWLNGNPLCRDGNAMAVLRGAAEKGGWEILNRTLTSSYGLWALLYLTDAKGPAEITRLDLKGRGLTSLKAEVFGQMTRLEALDLRGNPLLPDWTATVLPALQGLPRLKSLRIDVTEAEAICMEVANGIPALVWLNGRRVLRLGASVVGLEEGGHAEVVDRIMDGMWSLVEPIRVAETAGHHPELYWYGMDTPGLSVPHSDCPNLAMVALREPRLGVTFSAFWPIKTIMPGDRLSRDFMEGFPSITSGRERLFKVLWGSSRRGKMVDTTASSHSSSPPPPPPPPARPQPVGEGLSVMFPPQPVVSMPVWTDMPVLQQYLSDPRFPITHDPSEAAVLWTAAMMERQHPEQYTTSMPGLEAIDDKCLMAKLLQRQPPCHGLPRTFCLPEDLDNFLAVVSDGSDDEEGRGSRHGPWIVKPPHLARGWDILVLSSTAGVLRHLQASERLSVSAYIADPDTYHGHKYDLRLYCLILGGQKVLIHDHFRIRLAGQPYSMSKLDDVHVHLTNTTLESDGQPSETVSREDFIAGFAQEHGGREWGPVRESIDRLLTEAFSRLLSGLEPREPRGRALVGVDVLLDRGLKPWLIEVNASPNCLGLCVERPGFFDEVFRASFIDACSGNRAEDGEGFRNLVERNSGT